MAKRRRTAYGKRKRSFKRRKMSYRRRRRTAYTGNKRVFTINKSLVPLKMKKTFLYADKITIDGTTAGLNASHFYSCNSLWDPDRTGIGHQPMGFDEYLDFWYSHYCVIAAKLTATFISPGSAATSANQIASIYIRDTTTGPTATIQQAIEQGKVTYGILGSNTGGNASLTLVKTVNPAKFLGVSKPLSNDNLKGQIGASPAEECFFEINIASAGTDDPPAVQVLITIEYTAVLTERKKFEPS